MTHLVITTSLELIEPPIPVWSPLKGTCLTFRQKQLSFSDRNLFLLFLSRVLTWSLLVNHGDHSPLFRVQFSTCRTLPSEGKRKAADHCLTFAEQNNKFGTKALGKKQMSDCKWLMYMLIKPRFVSTLPTPGLSKNFFSKGRALSPLSLPFFLPS